MYKTKFGTNPTIFNDQFKPIQHKYKTRYSIQNFQVPKFNLKSSKYVITHRGPYLWNNFLSTEAKTKNSLKSFKYITKQELLKSSDIESRYF